MPGECAECHGPAEIAEHEWAPVELCVPCAIELRGRPTQADLAAAEQSATVTRDAQWREAVLSAQRCNVSNRCSLTRLDWEVCHRCAPLRALLETKA